MRFELAQRAKRGVRRLSTCLVSAAIGSAAFAAELVRTLPAQFTPGVAIRVTISATPDSGTKVFVVAKDDPGVSVTSLKTTGRDSVGHLELQGVELGADRVVGGDEVISWLTTHGALGRSAYQLGVLERALEKKPESRYPTTDEMAAAIRRAQGGLSGPTWVPAPTVLRQADATLDLQAELTNTAPRVATKPDVLGEIRV